MESVDIKPTYAELEAEVLRLHEELANLRRLIFGQKRERFVPAANAAPQLQMGLGDDRQAGRRSAPTLPRSWNISRASCMSNATCGRSMRGPKVTASWSARCHNFDDEVIQEINAVLRGVANYFYAYGLANVRTVNSKGQTATNNFSPTLSVSTKKLGNKIEIRIRDTEFVVRLPKDSQHPMATPEA